MNTKISTTRPLAAGLAATAAAALVVNAGSAYLPVTGPPPLRFEVAFVRPAALALMAAMPNLPENSEDQNPATGTVLTNTPEDLHYSSGQTNVPPATAGEPETSGTYPIHPLADSPLIITPQMLAEYFKPASGPTNAAVFLPVQVSFKPPTDPAPVRSRATYKTE